MTAPDLSAWLAGLIGAAPGDEAPFAQALTHGSVGESNYERLEFLGDRVLGLVIADWLCARFPDEHEGQLSRRFNSLVSGETCAEVAREIGVQRHIRLGKQARDDGAIESDNVLGDVMEALIGALYLTDGLESARALVRRLWAPLVEGQRAAPKHPKSALQEWAAANRRKPPIYALLHRSGPDHASRFVVQVAINGVGEAEAEGGSKQEAETAAAAALLAQVTS